MVRGVRHQRGIDVPVRPVQALGVMLVADAYLRPWELLGLMASSVVAPRPRLGSTYRFATVLLHPPAKGLPSKTGTFDNAVVLDLAGRGWLTELLLARVRQVAAWDLLFSFNRLIDFIFLKDMCMQFFLAYRIQGSGGGAGLLVRNFKSIRNNYLKSW